MSARERAAQDVLDKARALRRMVRSINSEEFSWQETHYDHDSRQGRELLFLMANTEWIRATCEVIDIPRSDEIETTIKIDIDLSQITHEAFRNRQEPVWLPVAVLPPQLEQRRSEPDLFAAVTDGAGNLVPMMPTVDLRHQISAAMAEIIVKMAVSHSPDPMKDESSAGTRDERLLLSAAIYRILQNGFDTRPSRSRPADESRRISQARDRLLNLLKKYIKLLEDEVEYARDTAKGNSRKKQFTPELARRAIKVLEALTESIIVVVWMKFDSKHLAPSVLTVRIPNRRLNIDFKPVLHQPRTWNWIKTPYDRLKIDMLLPTADADRQIQINLPKGVSVGQAHGEDTGQAHGEDTGQAEGDDTGQAEGKRKPRRPHPVCLDISVYEPSLLQDLRRSMEQVIPRNVRPPDDGKSPATRARRFIHLVRTKMVKGSDMLRQHKVKANDKEEARSAGVISSDSINSPADLTGPFIDLAREKSARAIDMLRHYRLKATDTEDAPPSDTGYDEKYDALETLAKALEEMKGTTGAVPPNIIEAWRNYKKDKRYLFRRTAAEGHTTPLAVARTGMIENVSQHAIPRRAAAYVDLTLDNHEYFSAARSSAFMSLILMLGVLAFLIFWKVMPESTSPNTVTDGPAPEVLAIVLTLFVTIQAERIERPDRSTLRGRLFSLGNWLVAASVLPAITLALALAFRAHGWTANFWAMGCILAQIVFLMLMWRGPLTSSGRFRVGKRRIFYTDPPDYQHFETLRSDYWRNTTAQALMIGREAYGYIIWQKANPDAISESESPKLRPLLAWQGNSVKHHQSNNVLALLRTGTLGQAITFVVFRDKPARKWAIDADGRQELDLKPDRLAPTDSVTSVVDIFIGSDRDNLMKITEHPLVNILKDAKNNLIVLDAQLPVPAPVAGYDDKQWARTRVALRDADDIGRLTYFLNAVNSRITGNQDAGHVVVVKAVPGRRLHIITEREARSVLTDDEADEPVLTGDLDIVHDPRMLGERADDPKWRVLTICADARSNIESDIISRLADVRDHFELTGLTYALLHGTAVMVLLVHDPTMAPGTADLQARLREDPALAGVQVPLDEQLSWAELGHASAYPMLLTHFRWQDQPGVFLNVLDSIKEALSGELESLENKDWSISYANGQVLTGQVATGHLTIRMHMPAEKVDWSEATMKEMGREIELAASAAAREAAADSTWDAAGPPENPSISIGRMMKPRSA